MEPITYTLELVASGYVTDDESNTLPVEVSLYEGSDLFTIIIKEEFGFGAAPANVYRATNEIRHQAVMQACMRSGVYNIHQVYRALGKKILPGGYIED